MSAFLSHTMTLLSRHTGALCSLAGRSCQSRQSHWFPSVLALKKSLPVRAEPRKKKKVDPKREQALRDRLKKKVKKLEKIPPEFIPIEDFVTPVKFLDETRVRTPPQLSLEESERRALLLKEWARFKYTQNCTEMAAISAALDAQKEALQQLRQESEELYQAAVKRDARLFPFNHQGPSYSPPIDNYRSPDGKYNDITKVYTQ